MQKTALLVICCLLLKANGFAQGVRDKNTLTLSVGPSIPMGTYAENNSEGTTGFAKKGVQANLSYVHRVGKHFGLSALLLAQKNAISTYALEQEFGARKFYQGGYPAPFPPTTQPPSTTYPNWQFDKDSWLAVSLQLGFDGVFPVSSGSALAFVAKATGGIVYASAPELKGNSITDTAHARIEQDGGSGWGIAYLVRGGMKYTINKKLSVLACADYLGTSEVKIKDITASFTSIRNPNGSPDTWSISRSQVTGDTQQRLGAIHLSLGLGLRL